MKHIGIVDITTVGACICANTIVANAEEYCPYRVHPEFTLNSLSFDLYKTAILKKDWPEVGRLIGCSIQKLEKIGADFIIVPSNTPHFAYDIFSSIATVPVLNIVELSALQCHQQNYKHVAVLGTSTTMNDGLYEKYLSQYGITTIDLSDTIKEQINSFIVDEIIPSKVSQHTTNYIAQQINQLEVDAVILACTELPAVFNENNLTLPFVDTTRLLAREALKLAVEES